MCVASDVEAEVALCHLWLQSLRGSRLPSTQPRDRQLQLPCGKEGGAMSEAPTRGFANSLFSLPRC